MTVRPVNERRWWISAGLILIGLGLAYATELAFVWAAVALGGILLAHTTLARLKP
jgi:Na+/proline symporter